MKILISDTHYGVKQNSITWINSQLDFIYNQLIPFCKKQKESVEIYHLGDVFDSRSSINPYIASRVRQAFIDLSRVVLQIYIIGGNHDYYSPNDDSVNSIDMVLYPESQFSPRIITKNMYYTNGDLLIPWYKYNDIETISHMLKMYKVRRVFCHADITMIDSEHSRLFKDVQVYSGHVHTPKHQYNLHTLGSTYALTFADCNSDRGFYVLDDNDQLTFHANEHSIKFYRLYNEEIFEDRGFKSTDYIELYIDQNNLLIDRYTKRIKELTSKYHNCSIIPRTSESTNEEFEGIDLYNIEELCKQCIPNELQEKFNSIINTTKDL